MFLVSLEMLWSWAFYLQSSSQVWRECFSQISKRMTGKWNLDNQENERKRQFTWTKTATNFWIQSFNFELFFTNDRKFSLGSGGWKNKIVNERSMVWFLVHPKTFFLKTLPFKKWFNQTKIRKKFIAALFSASNGWNKQLLAPNLSEIDNCVNFR